MDPIARRRARWLALVLLALAPCVPHEVDGQRRDDPARVHAAACVGELGWNAPDDACAAIVEVHVRRAAMRGHTHHDAVARTFSQAIRRPPPHRLWVPQLIRPGIPRAWPRHLSWRRHEARFAHYLEVVRATLEGERVTACPGATNYGGLMDTPAEGLVEVCRWSIGRGAQVFYAPAAATREDS